MHFVINTSIVPDNPRYLHAKVETKAGTKDVLCIMGQILQQLDEPTFYEKKPVKNLNDLHTAIPPFTRAVRGQHIQSDLASTIMQSSPSSQRDRERVGTELAKYGHTIEWK